jgi:diacylglycerol kinase
MKTIKSFKNAFSGIRYALKENTFKTLCSIAVIILSLSFFFKISITEIAIIIISISIVLGLELLNSQVERTLDIVNPNYNEKVKEIKDISAAAVLIASIGSFFVGILIFLPYFFKN